MLGIEPLDIFCLIVIVTVTAVGVMGNGFIVLANGFEWMRSKTVSPSDMILTALSLSRLAFLGLTLTIYRLFLLDVSSTKSLPTSVLFLWAFVNGVSLWMATCLAAFYCIKLVNVPQMFFVKLKLHVPWLVPRLLLGSVLVSLVISLPIFFFERCSQCCNETRVVQSTTNMTCSNILLSGLLYSVGNSPSFVIVLASSGLLIHSLLQHARKMQRNAGGATDYRMDVHIKAIKTLVSFVVLFSASFAAVVSLAVSISPWKVVLSSIVVTAYNSGHAVILIAMNPKLKQPLIRGLQDTINCCWREIVSFCPRPAGGNFSS